MNDFESRINAERERIRREQPSPRPSKRFNTGKNILVGAAATGLAALALAFSLRGGGNGEYDQVTKDSLKASLRPTAAKIARGAIKAAAEWGFIDREGNKMVVEVDTAVQPIGKGPHSYPYTEMDVSVTTGITDARADPKKVESVSITEGTPFGNNSTAYIDSPSSNNLPDPFLTGGQGYSGHGAWSGSVVQLRGQLGAQTGLQANTDNAFVASDAIGVIDPERDARIQTADMVAATADRFYDRLHSQDPGLWPDPSA